MTTPVLNRRTTTRFALALGTVLVAAGPVSAQVMLTSPEEVAAMRQAAHVGTVIVNVVVTLVFGAILLIAQRNMKGWGQPIGYVLFSFQGRLNRKAYWLKGVVFQSFMLAVALTVLSALSFFGVAVGLVAAILGLVIVLPMIVFLFWVSIALAVKRAHDLNHSGWWWFLGVLIPIWNIWVAIQILFFRGTVGANSFGADPIDPYDDYIDELAGGMDDGGDDDTSARPHPHSHPHPPQDDGPQGFGGRKFAPKPAPSAPAPAAQPVQVQENVDMDLIRRRLGDDFLKRDN